MPEQIFFEDVTVGMALPTLTRGPISITDLVKFSAATNDWTAFHFDERAARERNLPGPLIHGPLKAAILGQLLSDWVAPRGRLERLKCEYRRMDVAGDMLTFGGTVTAIVERAVECEIWSRNRRGETTTTGNATVTLPLRADYKDPRDISLITEEMRKDLCLGSVAGTFTYQVEAAWIGRFADAFLDANPLWHDAAYAAEEGRFGGISASPTFFAALDPVETKELLLDDWVDHLPYKNTGGGNAFNEVEYFLPVRAGDRITVEVTYTDIFEREGRSGRLLFRIRENVLRNQDGALVAKVRNGHVRSYDVSMPREH